MRSLLATYLFLKDKNFDFKILSKIPNFTREKYFENIVDLNYLKKNPLKISEYWAAAQSRINLQNQENLFKTHSACISFKNNWFTNETYTKGYIYLIRDPRSVVCSMAAHSNKKIEKCVEDLLNDICPSASFQAVLIAMSSIVKTRSSCSVIDSDILVC